MAGEKLFAVRSATSESTPCVPYGAEDLFRGKPTALDLMVLPGGRVVQLNCLAKETGEAPELPEVLDRSRLSASTI